MLDNRHNGDSIRKLHSAQAHIQLDENINSTLNHRQKLRGFNKLTFKTSIPNNFLLNLHARSLIDRSLRKRNTGSLPKIKPIVSLEILAELDCGKR
jgi:hypothetical protein